MGINREKEVRTGNHFKNQNASPFCPGKIPLDYAPTGNFLPVLYRAFEGWCSGALWWAFWFLKRPVSFSSFFAPIPDGYLPGIMGKRKKLMYIIMCCEALGGGPYQN
jgi:hypothetical protein